MSETANKLGGRKPAEPRVLAEGIRLLEGIEYASIRGFRPLLLDLYLPAGAGPWPAVVFIHGGGWGVGTRASVSPPLDDWSPSAFERIARAGLAVATVDYRLTGEAIFPAQLHDVKAAVRWLRSQADALGIDAERLVAWGASAGGHLAALVGLTGAEGVLEGDVGATGPSSAVCGVIDWYGPADLVSMEAQSDGSGPMEHDSAGSPEGSLIGGVVSENPERARAASPSTTSIAVRRRFRSSTAAPTRRCRAPRASRSRRRSHRPGCASTSKSSRAPTTCGSAPATSRRSSRAHSSSRSR